MGLVASMFLSDLPSEELSSDIPGARFLVYAGVAGTFEFTLILWVLREDPPTSADSQTTHQWQPPR